jgi:Protein of unknown function (DUF3105)
MTQPKTSKKKTPAKVFQPKREFPIIPVVVVVILVGLVALVIYAVYAATQPPQPIDGLASYPGLPSQHVDGTVAYDPIPPVGGNHNLTWQNCGVYTEPLQNEHAVHSLEHGAIWITYSPDLPADQVTKLQVLTRQSNYRLLSPYPGLTSPIVLSAWGQQLKVNSADDGRIATFIERYEQQGPEAGAVCYSGIGTPQ